MLLSFQILYRPIGLRLGSIFDRIHYLITKFIFSLKMNPKEIVKVGLPIGIGLTCFTAQIFAIGDDLKRYYEGIPTPAEASGSLTAQITNNILEETGKAELTCGILALSIEGLESIPENKLPDNEIFRTESTPDGRFHITFSSQNISRLLYKLFPGDTDAAEVNRAVYARYIGAKAGYRLCTRDNRSYILNNAGNRTNQIESLQALTLIDNAGNHNENFKLALIDAIAATQVPDFRTMLDNERYEFENKLTSVLYSIISTSNNEDLRVRILSAIASDNKEELFYNMLNEKSAIQIIDPQVSFQLKEILGEEYVIGGVSRYIDLINILSSETSIKNLSQEQLKNAWEIIIFSQDMNTPQNREPLFQLQQSIRQRAPRFALRINPEGKHAMVLIGRKLYFLCENLPYAFIELTPKQILQLQAGYYKDINKIEPKFLSIPLAV